ncbi:Aste57867_15538 [Aphanomyces stellatus]|uniref:Aste57867_15538 protein n=1 Tax=Aphanomyces stellatus TaxID=120398 RepID=A0A485L6A7_9STRA|nr:hypothetical protein As57867_015482 [Aphanomyces stellatus]VFT92340.1 Aste57867_15538 [Aphanomyces stellatus]
MRLISENFRTPVYLLAGGTVRVSRRNAMSSFPNKHETRDMEHATRRGGSVNPMHHTHALVMDTGARTLKGGFAFEDAPSAVIASVVGKVKVDLPEFMAQHTATLTPNGVFVGPDAQSHRGFLSIKSPLDCGDVRNWDDLESMWEYMLKRELQVEPQDHAVFLTDAIAKTSANMARMTQIMFESVGTAALHINKHDVLPLYATGRTTGCVLECGESATRLTAVHDGYALPECAAQSSVAGALVTAHLTLLLRDHRGKMSSEAYRDVVRSIKEHHTRVSICDEVTTDDDETYELPDGTTIHLDARVRRAPDVLFAPATMGRPFAHLMGIHEMTHRAISQCANRPMRRQLLNNIVLSGGTSMHRNLRERLTTELSRLEPSMQINVVASDTRQFGAWIGGSILASLSVFDQHWITKAQYDEMGPYAVHAGRAY